MSLSSPPLTPPTPEAPSPPPPFVYVPETRFEIWLAAHIEWLNDPTTSFFFWYRLYCSVLLSIGILISIPTLWILPSCFLPNHWKALWVVVLSFLGWQEKKKWGIRAAEFRRREEESERVESEKLESGLSGVLVEVDGESGEFRGDEKKGRGEV